MSTENQTQKNAPVHTHRDGSVFAKIWENQSTDGRSFHTVTFGKTYTDANGDPRETQGFSGVDVLKVQQLAQDAYRTVQEMRRMQTEKERGAAPEQTGLQAQRDAAMSNVPTAQDKAEQAQHLDQKPGHVPTR